MGNQEWALRVDVHQLRGGAAQVLAVRTAGVRTFAISVLLGGISGAIARVPSLAPGSIILSVGIAAYALVITVFCREENRAAGTFSARAVSRFPPDRSGRRAL